MTTFFVAPVQVLLRPTDFQFRACLGYLRRPADIDQHSRGWSLWLVSYLIYDEQNGRHLLSIAGWGIRRRRAKNKTVQNSCVRHLWWQSENVDFLLSVVQVTTFPLPLARPYRRFLLSRVRNAYTHAVETKQLHSLTRESFVDFSQNNTLYIVTSLIIFSDIVRLHPLKRFNHCLYFPRLWPHLEREMQIVKPLNSLTFWTLSMDFMTMSTHFLFYIFIHWQEREFYLESIIIASSDLVCYLV